MNKRSILKRIGKKKCRRKVRFLNVDTAERAAIDLSEKYQKETIVYLCPYGDHYHLTTTIWKQK
jgi:hypothetical protein